MAGDKLIADAKDIIGIKTLREEVTGIKSREKEKLIKELLNNDPRRLRYLLEYNRQLKKRSVFFSYSKTPLDFNKIARTKIVDRLTDLIFEFDNISIGKDNALVTIKAHSAVKEFKNAEEPEKLTPITVRFRRGSSISFIYHPIDQIIECRSRSLDKFQNLKVLIDNKFDLSQNPIELIKLTKSDYLRTNDARYKSFTALGLTIAGADTISIKGDDVEQTLKFFKGNDIDLMELSSSHSIGKLVTSNDIIFFDNGKITYRRNIKDIYSELRATLLEYIKSN
jgi:hypothetical protein